MIFLYRAVKFFAKYIKCIPLDYKKVTFNLSESISACKFPIGSWAGDIYTNWLTQNGLNIGTQFAGGALGITIVCLLHRKENIKITRIFDIGAVMLPLGQSIGRWGNYFNQEVYGAVDPNKIGLPISVFIQDTGKYHYALFLWEAILNAVLFALLYWFLFKYKGKRNGYSTGLYFIGYGLIRLIMEPLRDAQYNLPLFGIPSLGMVWVSIALILGGLSIIAVLFVKDFKENGKSLKKYFKSLFSDENNPISDSMPKDLNESEEK